MLILEIGFVFMLITIFGLLVLHGGRRKPTPPIYVDDHWGKTFTVAQVNADDFGGPTPTDEAVSIALAGMERMYRND